MGQVVFSRCFAVNKNGGCLLLRARILCQVWHFYFHLSLRWNGASEFPTVTRHDLAHTYQAEVRRSPQNRCHFSRGEEVSKKFRGFSNFSLCRTKNSLSCFAGKGRRGSRILGRQSTSVGILEYCPESTRVLPREYCSTFAEVLRRGREPCFFVWIVRSLLLYGKIFLVHPDLK